MDLRDEGRSGEPSGRVQRKRKVRRDALLDLAAELVERHGVAGVTMAALADAADYATASLYTYFPSRSALLAALQRRALTVLGELAEASLAEWDIVLDAAGARAGGPDPAVAALARLWAFAELFQRAPGTHPREFRLQQQLLVAPSLEDTADAAEVVPVAMGVLDVPRRLIDRAVTAGAIQEHHAVVDPIEGVVPGSLTRTLAWVVALNGALLVDDLAIGLPLTGDGLARELTRALLIGWGADPVAVDEARILAQEVCS